MVAVALADARARLSELVKLARAGEAVTITSRGKPVARIVAEQPARTAFDLDEMNRIGALATPYVDPDGMSYVERLRHEDLL